jgi:hypothetical protein
MESCCGRTTERKKSSHPGAPKDVPFLDLEVLPKTFNVFHQIPCGVLFQARTPIPSLNGFVAVLQKELALSTHGVDFPAPLWSKKMTYKIKKRWHAIIIYQRVASVVGKDEVATRPCTYSD